MIFIFMQKHDFGKKGFNIADTVLYVFFFENTPLSFFIKCHENRTPLRLLGHCEGLTHHLLENGISGYILDGANKNEMV